MVTKKKTKKAAAKKPAGKKKAVKKAPKKAARKPAVKKTAKKASKKAPKKPAWVIAHAKRTEFTQFPGRDTVKPQAGVDCAEALYKKAGITNPRKQIDCAELYVPFSWYEPMWLEGHLIAPENEGWKMTLEGATAIGGDFPVNM